MKSDRDFGRLAIATQLAGILVMLLGVVFSASAIRAANLRVDELSENAIQSVRVIDDLRLDVAKLGREVPVAMAGPGEPDWAALRTRVARDWEEIDALGTRYQPLINFLGEAEAWQRLEAQLQRYRATFDRLSANPGAPAVELWNRASVLEELAVDRDADAVARINADALVRLADEERVVQRRAVWTLAGTLTTAMCLAGALSVTGAFWMRAKNRVIHAQLEALERSNQQLTRAQQELVEQTRLAAVGEMAASLAHEVRNALGPIFNSLQLLRGAPSPADRPSLLKILGEEAERLDHVVRTLLELARPMTPRLREQSLEPLLRAAVAAVLDGNIPPGIHVECAVAPGLPEPALDAELIQLAFVNLLRNGIEAMPGGGHLALRAAAEPGRERGVRIEVTDTGPGIEPQVVPKIFDPFFTTKAAGTGVGLALVKKIVEQHGGTVSVTSRLGHGTTFAVVLGGPRTT